MAELIRKWLATRPRFHLPFTRTSASSLNLVECWFAILTESNSARCNPTEGIGGDIAGKKAQVGHLLPMAARDLDPVDRLGQLLEGMDINRLAVRGPNRVDHAGIGQQTPRFF